MKISQSIYLQQIPSNLTIKEINQIKAKTLSDQVTTKMEQEIMRQQIKQFSLPKINSSKISQYVQKTKHKIEEFMLNKVQSQKIGLINKIKMLEIQENDLKNKIRSNSPRKKSPYKVNLLTPNDHKQLKALIRQRNEFEIRVGKKNTQLFEIWKKRAYEQQKYNEKRLKIKQDKKKLNILKKIIQLQIKSNNRKLFIQSANFNIKNIEKNGYLYQINQIKQTKQKIQRQKSYQDKLQQLKTQYKISLNIIKQHQKKCQQQYKQHQKERKQKMIEDQKKKKCKSYANYYFQIRNKDRINQQKKLCSERSNYGHQMKQKVVKYQQKVNADHRPKVSSESMFKPMENTMSVTSLSRVEVTQKGNQYLEFAKKRKDLNKEEERKKSLTSIVSKRQLIDYSKTLKYKPSRDEEQELDELKKNIKILKDIDNTNRALQLTNKIQIKSKLSYDQKIFKCANHKIQILKALQ